MMKLQKSISYTLLFGVLAAFVWISTPAVPVYAQQNYAQELSQAFRDAIHKVKPAVVSIAAERTTEPTRFDPRNLEELPEFLRPFINPDMFNDEMFRQQRWQGSGIIITEDGQVITNNHVVKDADSLNVTLDDGTEVTAKVLSTDPGTDLALIQLDETRTYDFAKMGDSSQLQIGDWVLAIGNPFGLSQSVSEGIVSAKGRTNSEVPVGINEGFQFKDFIQTTAAINPGNSGGALINLNGEVVGINNSIQTAGIAANIGIGFAIPSNLATRVIEDLRKYKKVRRGYLGVYVNNEPSVKEHFKTNFNIDKGAIIDSVNPDTPAEKAGFKALDVILEVDGTLIEDNEHLISLVSQMPVGEEVEVLILRNGEKITKKLTLAERPDDDELAQLRPSQQKTLSEELMGFQVQTLTPELAEEKGYDKDLKGVLITQISPDAGISRTDLQRDDVISEVGSQAVTNEEEFYRELRKVQNEMKESDVKKRTVLMQVHRAGARLPSRYLAPTIELK